jgi:hypothetical protein
MRIVRWDVAVARDVEVGIIGDITSNRRMSFTVQVESIGAPRFERGRFWGPNEDMEALSEELSRAFDGAVVVEFGRDPSNGKKTYFAVTLQYKWNNELIERAKQIVRAAH